MNLSGNQERSSAGRRKTTSSRAISTSARSVKPSPASRSNTWSTRSSGDDAPAVSPTVSWPAEPGRVEVGLVVDEVGSDAPVARDLHEAVRVRARARADDEHERRLLADALDGVLAVLRRVADVGRRRPDEIREPLPQRVDDVGRVVQGKRGLRDVGDLLAVLDLEVASVLGRLDEDDGIAAPPPSCPRPRRGRHGRPARS